MKKKVSFDGNIVTTDGNADEKENLTPRISVSNSPNQSNHNNMVKGSINTTADVKDSLKIPPNTRPHTSKRRAEIEKVFINLLINSKPAAALVSCGWEVPMCTGCAC